MEKMKGLPEQLNSLPRYSLPDEKKKAILRNLGRTEIKRKRMKWGTPIIPSVGVAAILLVLFLSFNEGALPWNSGKVQLAEPGELFPAPHAPTNLLGVEGKVGILGPEQFIAEDSRRVAKLMLFFWGIPQESERESYHVEALSSKGEKMILSEGELSGPLYEEDAHVLTQFSPFPHEGEWQLSFQIGSELFEEFTVDVLPPLPKTESYTLLDSPKELEIGTETEVIIEKSGNGEKEIIVELRTPAGKLISTQTFHRDGYAIHAPTAQKLLMYYGSLTFPNKGKWVLVIDGEKTSTFQN